MYRSHTYVARNPTEYSVSSFMGYIYKIRPALPGDFYCVRKIVVDTEGMYDVMRLHGIFKQWENYG